LGRNKEDDMVNGWEKWHDWNAGMMRPVTAWFVEATRARPGARLLDAACGTGIPSLALAEHVRPNGHVIATDVSADMVAAAVRIASAKGAGGVEHLEMDMSALSFPDASFDAASAAFGLMFVPEPQRAVRELVRVVKPGAPVAVAVWDEAAKNPCLTTLFGPLARFVRTAAEPAPFSPFRLSAPGALAETLREAGLTRVEIVARAVGFDFASLQQHWEAMSDMASPLRAAAEQLSPSELAELKGAIAGEVKPYVVDGRVSIPGSALCAVGMRAR
jgi:ubiquinone/menaquinone biosynthesis C-methylase UbiE